MNLRLFFCIAMGVLVIHLGVVMLLLQLRPKTPTPPRLKPNFFSKSVRVVDAETGEATIHREITVSTKLAPREPNP